jgi:hypothetical protein
MQRFVVFSCLVAAASAWFDNPKESLDYPYRGL